VPAADDPARFTTRAWVFALVLLALLVCVSSALASEPTAKSRVASTHPQEGSEFCVPVSAAAAIARVRGPRVPANHKFQAKLFGTDYWAVEETSPDGDVEVGGPGDMGHHGWAVFNVDAHTDAITGASAGPPGSTPTDWNSLPDRTSTC
jgi:hypothetical protein